MKIFRILPGLAALTLLTVAASGPQQQALSNADIEEIEAIFMNLGKAMVADDIDGWSADFSEQVVGFWSNQRSAIGMANLRKTMESPFSNWDWMEVDFGVERISGSGYIAFATGVYNDTWRNKGETEQYSDTQAWGSILRKQADGTWKLLSQYFTPVGESFPAITDQDVAGIRTMFGDLGESNVMEDLGAVMDCYVDQAVEIFPNQVSIVGKANIRSRIQAVHASYDWPSCAFSAMEIEGFGSVAVAWGACASSYRAQGATEEVTLNQPFVTMLRKQNNGSWKILAMHWLASD